MASAATPDMQHLTAAGRRLEYYWTAPHDGDSPALVFLHEGLGSAGLWRDFPAQLTAETGLPALVYSRYGYGGSDVLAGPRNVDYMHVEAQEALPVIRDALDLDDVILVGHSDGASIALIHAAQHPVRGLILEAPHLFVEDESIAGIEDADALLLVGCNPRLEATLVNARIRKRWLAGGFPVAVIGGVGGPGADLTYKYDYLGAGPATLAEVVDGSHAFAKILADAERPMIIVGSGAVARDDGAAVLELARNVAEKTNMISPDWNGFNVLHRLRHASAAWT